MKTFCYAMGLFCMLIGFAMLALGKGAMAEIEAALFLLIGFVGLIGGRVLEYMGEMVKAQRDALSKP